MTLTAKFLFDTSDTSSGKLSFSELVELNHRFNFWFVMQWFANWMYESQIKFANCKIGCMIRKFQFVIHKLIRKLNLWIAKLKLNWTNRNWMSELQSRGLPQSQRTSQTQPKHDHAHLPNWKDRRSWPPSMTSGKTFQPCSSCVIMSRRVVYIILAGAGFIYPCNGIVGWLGSSLIDQVLDPGHPWLQKCSNVACLNE